MRNQTSGLWILHSETLLLSHRDSMVSKAHFKVHIWQASCILFGSAVSIASYFLSSIRKKVSCKLGIELEKDVFFVKASFSISFPSLKLTISLVLFTKKNLSLFLILLQYQQQPITGMATFVCLFMMKYATMIHRFTCQLNWQSAAPVSQRSWVQIPYGPEFFSGLIFTTA